MATGLPTMGRLEDIKTIYQIMDWKTTYSSLISVLIPVICFHSDDEAR